MVKKGFTLIELLAIFVLIGLLSMIAIISVTKLINSSKEKTYQQQINNIEKSAQIWATNNTSLLASTDDYATYVSIEELKQAGLLENKDIVDPRTDKTMTGCVQITYNTETKKYRYKYNHQCPKNLPTELIFSLKPSDIDGKKGWYKSSPTVTIADFYLDSDDKMQQVLANQVECIYSVNSNPSINVLTDEIKQFVVDEEGKNVEVKVNCIYVDQNNKKYKKSQTIYLDIDKTPPTITINSKTNADGTPYNNNTNQPVTVELTCDDAGGSGCDQPIYYRKYLPNFEDKCAYSQILGSSYTDVAGNQRFVNVSITFCKVVNECTRNDSTGECYK